MGRHDHDGPSWPPSSYTLQILLLIYSLPSTNRYDGQFQARRSIEGLRSITLKLLEFGYWDYFSDHHDEPAGQTIMATTVHHALCNPTLAQTSHFPSEASLRCHLRTVTSSVGGNVSTFIAQKLPRSSLGR